MSFRSMYYIPLFAASLTFALHTTVSFDFDLANFPLKKTESPARCQAMTSFLNQQSNCTCIQIKISHDFQSAIGMVENIVV
jgi:hypothetical protein